MHFVFFFSRKSLPMLCQSQKCFFLFFLQNFDSFSFYKAKFYDLCWVNFFLNLFCKFRFKVHFFFLWASRLAQTIKDLPTVWETWVPSLGWEDPLEKRVATHSCILAWRIPWIEKPGSWTEEILFSQSYPFPAQFSQHAH